MYECTICHAVNNPTRLRCKACGAVPAVYSVLKQPTRIIDAEENSSIDAVMITVHVAFGAERCDQFRTTKSLFRTVPADYYATGVD